MSAFTDLEQLWHAHHADLMRQARRKVGAQTAEDIVQDVFCRALKAMLNGNGYTDSAGGWLYRILRNRISDHYREHDRKRDYALDDIAELRAASGDAPTRWGDPVRAAEISADAATVTTVLAQLSEVQQQAIALRYLDGYEFSEIGAALNKKHEAVKAIVSRGLKTANLLLGGTGRLGRRAGRQEAVQAALRAHGPMTIAEIARVLKLRAGEVKSAIYTNEKMFLRVGTVEKGRVTIYVWDVAGGQAERGRGKS